MNLNELKKYLIQLQENRKKEDKFEATHSTFVINNVEKLIREETLKERFKEK